MMALRLSCCVPFCPRTRGQRKGEEPIREGEEWVCGDHWKAVPKPLRRVHSRIAREIRKAAERSPLVREYWMMEPGAPERVAAVNKWTRHRRIWRRCKRAAIERAIGVA